MLANLLWYLPCVWLDKAGAADIMTLCIQFVSSRRNNGAYANCVCPFSSLGHCLGFTNITLRWVTTLLILYSCLVSRSELFIQFHLTTIIFLRFSLQMGAHKSTSITFKARRSFGLVSLRLYFFSEGTQYTKKTWNYQNSAAAWLILPFYLCEVIYLWADWMDPM